MSEGGIVMALLCLAGSALMDFVDWRLLTAGTSFRRPQPTLASKPERAALVRLALAIAALGVLMLAGLGEIAVLTCAAGVLAARLAAALARARRDDPRGWCDIPMVYLAFALVLTAYIVNGVLQSPGAEGDLLPMQGCVAGVLLHSATRGRRRADRGALRSARLFLFCVCAVSLGMLISSLRIPVFASACVFPLVLGSAACLATVIALLLERYALPVALLGSRHAPAFLLSAVLSGGLFWVLCYLMLPGNHAATDGSSYALSHLWWALLSGEVLAALVLRARQCADLRRECVRLVPLALLALAAAGLSAGSLGVLLALLAAMVLAAPWISLV